MKIKECFYREIFGVQQFESNFKVLLTLLCYFIVCTLSTVQCFEMINPNSPKLPRFLMKNSKNNFPGDEREWGFGFGFGSACFSLIFLVLSLVLLICDRESEEIFYKEREAEEEEEEEEKEEA